MYAASANLVLTTGTGNGVNGFTLDNALGEFILTHPNVISPLRSRSYCRCAFPRSAAFILSTKETQCTGMRQQPNTSNPSNSPNLANRIAQGIYSHNLTVLTFRYIGSMVADVHRTLLYGGIFSYPSDSKSPRGKLRLLYECFPMAKLVEEAGGLAFDGKGRILEQLPKSIHERGPVWLGSYDEVSKVIEIFKRHEKK
jgi:fructose-1,6-bisphosphatase I